MKRTPVLMGLAALIAATLAGPLTATDSQPGPPPLTSMSALTFAPDGTLFIGDGKAGAIWAVELGERSGPDAPAKIDVQNLEAKIAALLGTTADTVMIHDLATDPISGQVYLAVSRGRTGWESRWQLPNDIADATILLRVGLDGALHEARLDEVTWTRAALPNPIDAAKTHRWKKGVSRRADTITDLAYRNGTLFVAGLSNEEFASTLWRIPYPFGDEGGATTLEIFHGAHGAYETHAPIRTFVPYALGGKEHVLAAYLCTPLVTFETQRLLEAEHLRGRTVAEFGSGNYPLDMIVYRSRGEEKLLIANSNMPLMLVRPRDIEAFEGEITEEVEGYVAGVPYEIRSGVGIQQLDNLNEQYVVALQRLPGGTLDLVSLDVNRF